MSDREVIKTPKYIVYEGNLYELKEMNIEYVVSYDELLKEKELRMAVQGSRSDCK